MKKSLLGLFALMFSQPDLPINLSRPRYRVGTPKSGKGHTGTKKFFAKHPGQKTQLLEKQKARIQKRKVKRARHQKSLKAVA